MKTLSKSKGVLQCYECKKWVDFSIHGMCQKCTRKSKGVKEKLPEGQNNCCDNGNFGDNHRCLKIAPSQLDNLAVVIANMVYDYQGSDVAIKPLQVGKKIAGQTLKETIHKLMQQFLKENPMVLSDDVPDAFDSWLSFKKNENPAITVNWTGNTTDNLESK